MNQFLWKTCVAGVVLASVSAANANIIPGPTLTQSGTGNGDTSWGEQFHANQDSALIGFTFNHRNGGYGDEFHGNFVLVDVGHGSHVLASYGVNAPAQVVVTGIWYGLIAGHDYQLIVTPQSPNSDPVSWDQTSNYLGYTGDPAGYGDPSYTNTDITVTNGVFSGNTSGFYATNVWYAFNDITTKAVPVPGSLALLASGVCGLLGWRGVQRWQSRRKAS
jgi:hypothetical protein